MEEREKSRRLCRASLPKTGWRSNVVRMSPTRSPGRRTGSLLAIGPGSGPGLRTGWRHGSTGKLALETEGQRNYLSVASINDIKELRDIAPYKLFEPHLTSGRTLPVMTPDHLLISPRGDLLVLFPPGGGVCVIDPTQVASLNVPDAK